MPDLSSVKVGDTLLCVDRNARRGTPPREETVVKVGRTLIHIEAWGDRTLTYRIADGIRNDNYGHSWLMTREQYEDKQERAAYISALSDLGVSFRFASGPDASKLERILAIMEETDHG